MTSPGLNSDHRPNDVSTRADESAATRPAKRNRATIACTNCRQRKSRCDGLRPKCSVCKDYSLECAYSTTGVLTKNSISKGLIEALEARLIRLENGFTGMSTRVSKIEDVQNKGTACGSSLSHPSGIPSDVSLPQEEESARNLADLEDPTDGMGSMIFTDEEDLRFFGPSSNIAFTRRIVQLTIAILKKAASMGSPISPEQYTITSHIPRISRPPSPIPILTGHFDAASVGTEPFILPPQQDTLHLIELYFRSTGTLFPYIDKEGFLQTYRQLVSTNIVSVRRSWLGLLNVVLAMATNANTDYDATLSAQERTYRSNIYFRRASDLCDRQIRHGTSVEIVQLLLLMSQYLQGSERSVETWNIHGLAVKAAYQLGLHSSDALQQYPPREREFRKRTWYGTLSMTMGRPISIPEHFVKIELPQILEDSAPEDEGSVQFFTATITLYRIMTDVLDVLYGSNLGCEDHTDVFEAASYLLRCEQKFFSWQRDLPKQISLIRLEDLEQEANDFRVMSLRIILTLRFLNLRILAHRPILCMYLESLGASQIDPLQLATLRQVGANSVQLCVQSATNIVKITSWALKHNSPHRNLLGAWWFSLYYTFNASLVLYSALIIQHQTKLWDQPMAMEELHLSIESLHGATECLSLIFKGNRMAEKCVRYTSALSNWLSVMYMSENHSAIGIPNLLNTSSERFAMQGDSDDSAQSHEHLHFYDSTDLHLGLDSGELLNPSDFSFLCKYSEPNVL
ncbi:hypothetical protein COCC4DRAFT_75864 [Bipolaris maydis ATCC 48331]|uniref:Zn(2)-C6 fungal-type domain-containing protein n=2 Tax=Cochliobolus heterostrophus TaxID=5016 RepID=M2UZC3_COCH5|nr:uncharacterized protein COCC4DRAFT_75864 [Bipolaris maydis ATCC 48331]EMD93153.1 hypothetical protein COCHEDRAFT_1193459 [Bipolaris maydis C5]KAJ5025808.1 fungal-specific transcription factor domain-containing protein [Bipolaris maydis]ENI00253.1 hypothetical protein COCC4DRAFT_75864 [Bipolaris maydis ATCC 48331]KAJ6195934.1 fungal-specific transcription factor domain-containing protein [Bipolaris maydis]KAJ6208022.1 fungal-specific transcription factor domain-containing protein [Bipolaris 